MVITFLTRLLFHVLEDILHQVTSDLLSLELLHTKEQLKSGWKVSIYRYASFYFTLSAFLTKFHSYWTFSLCITKQLLQSSGFFSLLLEIQIKHLAKNG